jgi:two-component system CheB/CheR fusion protein
MPNHIKSLFARSTALASLANAHKALGAPAIVVPLGVPDARADEIAVISHELRNSLGVVRNAARLLRSPAGATGIDRARVLIERHVGQISRHIEDLLDAAHPDARKRVLRLTHVSLQTIVEFAVNDIASDLLRRGHRLVMKLPAEAIWVHADVTRLEQVFSNLLINAAKYTPDGGEIVLTLERTGAFASIRIRDSGIGIAPAVLLRVFDMFAQADATAACAEGGSGIGLAVVRELVELHGGSVKASSAGLGFGSEFTVLLPAPWVQAGE